MLPKGGSRSRSSPNVCPRRTSRAHATSSKRSHATCRPRTYRNAARRRPTRFLFALLGSIERDGRIRVRRRIGCLMGFGNIDLDLRQATFEGDVITIVALGAFGAIDVYVPEGVEVDLHGFAFGGHKEARGNDPLPLAGTPLLRVLRVRLLRRHRRLARADRVGAEELERRDPRHRRRQAQGTRRVGAAARATAPPGRTCLVREDPAPDVGVAERRRAVRTRRRRRAPPGRRRGSRGTRRSPGSRRRFARRSRRRCRWSASPRSSCSRRGSPT